MGKKGTEAAKEASEMILADDNFNSICSAVEEGRTVYDNLRKAILYILPTNLGEALIVMLAILFGQTLPITPVQILWINMITTITLALTIGFEPAEDHLMSRPPKSADEPLLTPHLIWQITFVSILIVVFAFGLFLLETHMGTSVATARTVAVNMLVAGEAVYLLNCRRIHLPTWKLRILFGSKPILFGIGLVAIFQLLFTYLPIMGKFFGSSCLNLRQWFYILISAVLLYFLIEVEKLFVQWIIKK
jgi:magnesium-transporting ATPase (P-type)